MIRLKVVILAIILILGGIFTVAPRNLDHSRISRRSSIAARVQKHTCQSQSSDNPPDLELANVTSTSIELMQFVATGETYGVMLSGSLLRLLCILRP